MISGGGASAGAIHASIDFDAAGLERAVEKAMRKATGQIEDSLRDVQSEVESGFSRLGKGILGFLGIAQISDAVRQAGGFILQIGRETESALNNFRAVSGATAEEMEVVSEKAKALGNDAKLTGTSAADAALAMTELAKAGFSVDESMEAAKGTLQLATAAQIDAGRAAEISSKQLQAFGLEVSDAGFVADVLANAANETSADMQGMADSLNQVGAVAHASGLSFEETSAAVALMADNAIVGSDAGTSLKSMLLSLQAPSNKAAGIMEDLGINVYNADGSMKSLAEITGVLEHAFEGATDKQRQFALATIFGTDAIRAVNVLMNQGADGMTEMTERMVQSGAAADLAAANARGLVGALGAVQNVVETVAIDIYQKFAPALEDMLRGGLEKLPGILDEAADYLNEVGDSLEPAARLLEQFTDAAKPAAVIAFKTGLAALLGVLKAIGLVLEPIADLIEDHEQAFKNLVTPILLATAAYKALTGAVSQTRTWKTQAITRYGGKIQALDANLRLAARSTGLLRSVGSGLFNAMGGPWGVALAGATVALGVLASQNAEAKAQVDELAASLDEQTGALTENTRATAARILVEDEGFDAERLKNYGLTVEEITDAVLKGGDALANVQDKMIDQEDTLLNTINLFDNIPFRTDSAEEYATVLGKVSDRLRQAQEEEKLQIEASHKAATAKIAEKMSAEQAARAITGSSEATIQAEKRLMDQAHGTADAMGDQADQTNRAKRAIEGLKNKAIEGLEAQIGFEAAIDNLRKTTKQLTKQGVKHNRMLDIGTDAGRQFYNALIDVANSSAEVEGGMKRARQKIFETIRPMVDSKAEAKRLTDQFFKMRDAAESVPENVHVKVDADTASAMRKFNEIQFKLQDLDGERATTYVETVYTQSGKRFKDVPSGVPGNAMGGPIYGEGTGTSDDVLRRLSDGEHVWTAAEVKAAGGHAGVFALREAVKTGSLAALAEGQARGALVDTLAISVGDKSDLRDAMGEAMFHLRRIKRGGRYN